MTDDLARQILHTSKGVLLDFDGPVCSVFAGLPAPQVADRLRGVLLREGLLIPDAVRRETDPLEVLRFSATLGIPSLASRVDDVLCAAELAAVSTAAPTEGSETFIHAMHSDRRPLAIVSNNSAASVAAYLAEHRLDASVQVVVGRRYGEPQFMKPQPAPLLEALQKMNVAPDDAVLIGDSVTDVEAARAAGVACIALANRAGKYAPLQEAGAAAVITGMSQLASVLP